MTCLKLEEEVLILFLIFNLVSCLYYVLGVS